MNHAPPSQAPSSSPARANFDAIARPYRWLEYLTLGSALTHCREHFLSAVTSARHALVLGDGDGRFGSALLRECPDLTVTAVDSSRRMLDLLARRCAPHRRRLIVVHSDALRFLRSPAFPLAQPFDLIVTHFFLDCLHQPELDDLALRIAGVSAPGALWVISDFTAPVGWRGAPARLLIGLLYRAFGLLTGLAVRRLPAHADALRRAGFGRIRRQTRLAGLLTAELWCRTPAPRPL